MGYLNQFIKTHRIRLPAITPGVTGFQLSRTCNILDKIFIMIYISDTAGNKKPAKLFESFSLDRRLFPMVNYFSHQILLLIAHVSRKIFHEM